MLPTRSSLETNGLRIPAALYLACRDARDRRGCGELRSSSGKASPSPCCLLGAWKSAGKALPTLRRRKAVTAKATTSAWIGRSVLVRTSPKSCDQHETDLERSTWADIVGAVWHYRWTDCRSQYRYQSRACLYTCHSTARSIKPIARSGQYV